MSGWTTVFVGALTPLGTVIVAGLPSFIVTVGRPFFGATALPAASSRTFDAETTSTTKTTGSSFSTPSVVLPWSPNASFGVDVMSTRLPTFLPGSWLLNDGKRSCVAQVEADGAGLPGAVRDLAVAPVDDDGLDRHEVVAGDGGAVTLGDDRGLGLAHLERGVDLHGRAPSRRPCPPR